MSKADLVEAPTLTRREQETALWKESLQSYIDEMDSGWDGVLERGDPLEQMGTTPAQAFQKRCASAVEVGSLEGCRI